MTRWFRSTAAALCAALFAATAGAQAPAGDAVRLVVPFDAGGGTDIVARVIAQGLTAELGRSVVVLNRGGAGTRIGTELVAKSAPDGQTLLYSGVGLTFHPAIFRELSYDVKRDLLAVSTTGRQPNILIVGPALNVRNVTDIVALGKQKPGELTFGTAGLGSGTHIASEMLWITLGIKPTHVPYKGTAPALTDLIGGRIDLVFTTFSAVSARIKAGQLKAVGVSSPTRSRLLPDLPTIAEQGLPGYEYFTWAAIFARAGTPEAVQANLAQAIARALTQPKVREVLETDGLLPFPLGPQEAQRYYLSEIDRWTGVIQRAGIQAQ